jgi:glutamate/tyrosine decarboxylase-like PLP-dependent enzyme
VAFDVSTPVSIGGTAELTVINLCQAKYSEDLDLEDWDQMRSLGHRMVDDIIDDLLTLRDKPVWQPVPEHVRHHLSTALPLEPIGAEAAYEDFRQYVSPYPRGNTHPRFWGWVNGSGLPLGIFADLLAAAMNSSVGAFENAATLVEEQVLDWLKAMLGFPQTTSAVLTSGCSMSNIIGLAVARTCRATVDVRSVGAAGLPKPMVLYASSETHSSVRKAVELLGLGRDALRTIPVDDELRIDVSALEACIVADHRDGLEPFCVVANVGTVNTGAIDNLTRMADLCAAHNLWLHIDGAFGALAWLCDELRPALKGLQRADSLAFDLHKWMYLPYDVGCIFVRDEKAHHDAFAVTPTYLSRTVAGPASHLKSFADCGIELTRRFRALKVWMTLKAYGVQAFERQIRKNVKQAAYLSERIESHPDLELAAPVRLNVVCFRYVAPCLGPEELDQLNEELLVRLQLSGTALPSHTILNGRFVIRVAITNHRSEYSDFDLLVQTVARLGASSKMLVTRDK